MPKRIKINYKKERVLLSEVLPFEVPATYSNRHFYNFLVEEEINSEDIKKKPLKTPAVSKIIHSIFKENGGKFECKNIPFCFRISHKENDFRELAIPHPINQLRIIEFYEKYQSLILYYSSLSPFSIRKPFRVASNTFFNDRKFRRKAINEIGRLEEFDKEYKNQKSYFVYADYSNVHKFYESATFHRCEKKYNKLLKLDITKCFDSIYTHSISWAIFGKDFIKAHLDNKSKNFVAEFDALIQHMNYSETNGILIGPELSRIFAELILQSVDVSVERLLREEHILHKKHYEIFRYVDDYFVFYNNDNEKEKITSAFQHELKKFKLSLNAHKEEEYSKPIITQISIAKERIKKLLSEKLDVLIEIDKTEVLCKKTPTCDHCGKEKLCAGKPHLPINIHAGNLITEFKAIIKQTGISYNDILNYALALIESYSTKIVYSHKNYLKKYANYISCEKQIIGAIHSELDKQENKNSKNKELRLAKNICEIIEFAFFICSVSPRVNTVIKLSRISMVFVNFFNNRENISDIKHSAFKVISDNVSLMLKRNKLHKYTQIETLYLLLILDALGKHYRLDAESLMDYVQIEKDPTTGNLTLKENHQLNYFAITVLLRYVRDLRQYADIRIFIEQQILDKFNKNKSAIRKSTELILLLLDTLSCPYITLQAKHTLLTYYEITSASDANAIIQYRECWFTDWNSFNYHKELEAKRSREVY